MPTMSLPTIANITPPSSPLLDSVLSYLRKHTSLSTVNHSIRPVYFMQLLAKRLPPFSAGVSAGAIDLETAMLALLMHDLGWATTKELLSKDKRFEVDGADLAVKLIQDCIGASKTTDKEWDSARLEALWTSIALHSTPSIANHHPNPTVGIVQVSIMADFVGPNFPPHLPQGLVTVDEYKAILKEFPREGFREDVFKIMCGLCRDKKETTFDNFVSSFGKKFGMDGKGTGKEEFARECEKNDVTEFFMSSLDKCAEIEKEI